MKKYSINVHYDMVINVEVVADSLEQAKQTAYDQAAGMDIGGAECVGHDECLADEWELTGREVRRMENEKVQEFVADYVEQQTPTEVHDIAEGCGGVNWLEWVDDEEETAFYNTLFRAISNCEHPRTAVFDRYARMYARQRWQEVEDRQRMDYYEAWNEARAKDKALIIETLEPLYDEQGQWEGNRYFMAAYQKPRNRQETGYWLLTRCGNEYCAPEDNIGWAAGTQAACRLTVRDDDETPTMDQLAFALIQAGRVLDIYALSL